MRLYTNECLYKDVYTIIKMMNPDMRSKISNNFINFLRENQDTEFEGTINEKIPLKNQKIRGEIKLMLSLIFISYLCPNEKKQQILKQEKEKIDSFYNREIFSQKGQAINEDTNKSATDTKLNMIEYKESLVTKIFRKIRTVLWYFRKRIDMLNK